MRKLLLAALMLAAVRDAPTDDQPPAKAPSMAVRLTRIRSRPYVGWCLSCGDAAAFWYEEWHGRQRLRGLTIWASVSDQTGWGLNLDNGTIWRHEFGHSFPVEAWRFDHVKRR